MRAINNSLGKDSTYLWIYMEECNKKAREIELELIEKEK